MDINDAYGITMKESESVTADDLASSVTDVFLQHNELGKNDSLKKKSIKQNEHSIDVVSFNENHKIPEAKQLLFMKTIEFLFGPIN